MYKVPAPSHKYFVQKQQLSKLYQPETMSNYPIPILLYTITNPSLNQQLTILKMQPYHRRWKQCLSSVLDTIEEDILQSEFSHPILCVDINGYFRNIIHLTEFILLLHRGHSTPHDDRPGGLLQNDKMVCYDGPYPLY